MVVEGEEFSFKYVILKGEGEVSGKAEKGLRRVSWEQRTDHMGEELEFQKSQEEQAQGRQQTGP